MQLLMKTSVKRLLQALKQAQTGGSHAIARRKSYPRDFINRLLGVDSLPRPLRGWATRSCNSPAHCARTGRTLPRYRPPAGRVCTTSTAPEPPAPGRSAPPRMGRAPPALSAMASTRRVRTPAACVDRDCRLGLRQLESQPCAERCACGPAALPDGRAAAARPVSAGGCGELCRDRGATAVGLRGLECGARRLPVAPEEGQTPAPQGKASCAFGCARSGGGLSLLLYPGPVPLSSARAWEA